MKLLRFGLFSVFLVQMLTGVSVAQSALLPRASQDEQTLYAWLSSFDNNDFEVPRESITYTEGVSSSQELYALFYGLSGAAPDTDLINYPSRAFLLDDGKGEGIEGNGETVRILSAARSTTIGPQTAGADYLQFTGPGIFNPYYRDTGLANRLATQAVAMMMRVNDALYNDGGASFSEYVGMALAQCMSAFEAAKPYAQGITPSVSKAFYKTVESVMNWWDTNGGPRDVNTNMDTKGFYGLALLYVGSRAEGMTSISENAKNMAQKWLLGDTTDPGRAEGHKTGVIFHSAGYIGEKNMPETSYNGISLYYMVKTAAVVYGDGEWEWLWGPDGIVDRMARFKAYQIFPDPDGQYNGPSGYAVRTAFPYAEDQHSSMGRDFLVAQLSDYGLPIVYKRYNMAWDSTDITPKSLSLLDSNVRHYLKRTVQISSLWHHQCILKWALVRATPAGGLQRQGLLLRSFTTRHFMNGSAILSQRMIPYCDCQFYDRSRTITKFLVEIWSHLNFGRLREVLADESFQHSLSHFRLMIQSLDMIPGVVEVPFSLSGRTMLVW